MWNFSQLRHPPPARALRALPQRVEGLGHEHQHESQNADAVAEQMGGRRQPAGGRGESGIARGDHNDGGQREPQLLVPAKHGASGTPATSARAAGPDRRAAPVSRSLAAPRGTRKAMRPCRGNDASWSPITTAPPIVSSSRTRRRCASFESDVTVVASPIRRQVSLSPRAMPLRSASSPLPTRPMIVTR